MRTLTIGDIHGNYQALLQVLDRASFNIQTDKLIFLGDYVDRWYQSSELIDFLITISEICTYKPVFIRGNHDKWCEDWLVWGRIHPMWPLQGGQATIDSYIKTGYLTTERHREFFTNMENYYVDEQNRGFVHGGFISRKGLGKEVHQADYYWDRDLWGIAFLQDKNYKKNKLTKIDKYDRFNNHKEIYIGHTTTMSHTISGGFKEFNDPNQPKQGGVIVPMNRCNVWNMDTGCGYKGKLSIMDIDTKEYWQSDLVETLELVTTEIDGNNI